MYLAEIHLDLPIKGHCNVVLGSEETNDINLHGKKVCITLQWHFDIHV